MRLRYALVSALLLASCAPRPTGTPAPLPEPARPVVTPPAATPERSAPRVDSVPVAVAVPVTAPDSIALAKQARDSALDAAILDRLATAKPPEAPEAPVESGPEAVSLRSMFDIDVVNWADHNRVKYYLDFFAGPARERMLIWLQRMPRYEPTIRTQLIARGLPGDLAYLPLIESGYSSTAVSRSRAVGMWQFMRSTGRLYGLKVDSWVDERRDVVKATDAAIRFLADLTAKFGSPYLAAAAYNGGPGRIQRGLARIDLVDDAVDDSTAEEDSDAPQARDAAFFQLADTRYIKRETKDYVPKLIAAALIAKQPARYGFPAVPQSALLENDSVVVSDATGLDVVARLTGVSLADLWATNPAYIRAVTPPKRHAVIRVPAGSGRAAQAALDALPASERLTGFAHHAKSGETLARIAKRYGVTPSSVRASNPQYANRAPRAGEVVRIPGQARLAGWIAENRRVIAEAGSGSVHRVRRGETLGGIAARYRVSIAKLRAWNHLGPKSMIRAGQLLRVSSGGTTTRRPTRVTASPTKRVHIVKAGETLTSLARHYKVSVRALRSANSIAAGRPLLAGQRLTIPS